RHPGELGRPHLVIVPSSSRPATDLAHHRRSGLADTIAGSDAVVLGLGTGLDMLSRAFVPSEGDDPDPAAGGPVTVRSGLGLALLDLTTEAVTERRPHLATGRVVDGPGSGNTIDASDRGARHVRPPSEGG